MFSKINSVPCTSKESQYEYVKLLHLALHLAVCLQLTLILEGDSSFPLRTCECGKKRKEVMLCFKVKLLYFKLKASLSVTSKHFDK